jgi:hypothetical protein
MREKGGKETKIRKGESKERNYFQEYDLLNGARGSVVG